MIAVVSVMKGFTNTGYNETCVIPSREDDEGPHSSAPITSAGKMRHSSVR
jgi:hypothetical protein